MLNDKLTESLKNGRRHAMEYNRVISNVGLGSIARSYIDRLPYRKFDEAEELPEGCVKLPDGGVARPSSDNKIFILGHAEVNPTNELPDSFMGTLDLDPIMYEPNVKEKHFNVTAYETAITIRTAELLEFPEDQMKPQLATVISKLLTEQLAKQKARKPDWVVTEKINGCFSWTQSSQPGSVPPIDSLENSTFTRRFDNDWIEVLPQNIDIVDIHYVSDYGHLFDDSGISTVTQDIECLVLWYDVEAKDEFSKYIADKAIRDIQYKTKQAINANLTPRESRRVAALPEHLSEAECKALKTLRDLITERAYRRYLTNGFIMVKGKENFYQVFRDSRHTKVYRDNRCIKEICINTTKDCPPTDHVINLKLLIEFDENEIWNGGNTYHHISDRIPSIEQQPQSRLIDRYRMIKQEWYG